MKKLLLFIAVAFSMSAMAQNESKKVTFAPKVGFNMAYMSDDNEERTDNRYGFVVGGELQFGLSSKFDMSVGLLYSQQGGKDDDNGASVTYKMDYINLPVLLHYNLGKGFSVKAGLEAGFLINDKAKISQGGASLEYGIKEAFKNSGADASLPSPVLSLPIGFAYEVGDVVIDARYNIGLTNCMKFNDQGAKSNVFQITLGYKFAL